MGSKAMRSGVVGMMLAAAGCPRVVVPKVASTADAAPEVLRLEVEPNRQAAAGLPETGLEVAAYAGDTLVIHGSHWDPAAAEVRVGSRRLDVAAGGTDRVLTVVLPEALDSGPVVVLSGGKASAEGGPALVFLGSGHVQTPQFTGALAPQLSLLAMGVGSTHCRSLTGTVTVTCADINAPTGVLTVAFRPRVAGARTYVANVAPSLGEINLQTLDTFPDGTSLTVHTVQTYLGNMDRGGAGALGQSRAAVHVRAVLPDANNVTALLFDDQPWPLENGTPDATMVQRGLQKWLVLVHEAWGASASGDRLTLLPGPEWWDSAPSVETRADNVVGWDATDEVGAFGMVERGWFPDGQSGWTVGMNDRMVWMECPTAAGDDPPVRVNMLVADLPAPETWEGDFMTPSLPRPASTSLSVGATCTANQTGTQTPGCQCAVAVCASYSVDGSERPASRLVPMEPGKMAVLPAPGVLAPVCVLDLVTGSLENISAGNTLASDVLPDVDGGRVYWVPTDENSRALRQIRQYTRALGVTAHQTSRTYKQLVVEPFLRVIHGLPETGNRVHTLDATDVRLRDTPGVLGRPVAVWPLRKSTGEQAGMLAAFDSALVHLDETGGVRAIVILDALEIYLDPSHPPYVETDAAGTPVALWLVNNQLIRLNLRADAPDFPAPEILGGDFSGAQDAQVMAVTAEQVLVGVHLGPTSPARAFAHTCASANPEDGFVVSIVRTAVATDVPAFVPGTCGVQADLASAYDPQSQTLWAHTYRAGPQPTDIREGTLVLPLGGAAPVTVTKLPHTLVAVAGMGVLGVFADEDSGAAEELGALSVDGTYAGLAVAPSRDSQLAVSPDQRRIYVTSEDALLEYLVVPGQWPPRPVVVARHALSGRPQRPWLTHDGSTLLFVLADDEAVGLLQ